MFRVLEFLLDFFFGCSHKKISFPLTCSSGSGAAKRRATYVTCLECGAELAYDWEQMRVGAPFNRSRVPPSQWTEWSFEHDEIGEAH